MGTETQNPGAVAATGAPNSIALASESEFKASRLALQARVLAFRFGMLPDQALAVAFLAFEHGRAA